MEYLSCLQFSLNLILSYSINVMVPYTQYEEDDEEDDLEFVQRVLYDEDEDEDEEDEEGGGVGSSGADSERIMYADFFGGPPPGARSRHGAGSSSSRPGRGMGGRSRGRDEAEDEDADGDDDDEYDFDGYNENEGDGDDDDDNEDEDENENDHGPEKTLTRYEKQRLERQKEIAAIEQRLVQQKSWDMRGEINAKERPENSLLEISAEMER